MCSVIKKIDGANMEYPYKWYTAVQNSSEEKKWTCDSIAKEYPQTE